MKPLLLIVTLLFLVKIEPSFSKIIRRYFFTGILSDGEHPQIDYADTNKDEWKNLTSLGIKHGLDFKMEFCSVGDGLWILYPKEGYKHGSLYYTLLIGDYCINAQFINSIQSLGFIFGLQGSLIAYFTEPYFTSEAKIVYKGSATGDMKSIIYAGSEPWTLEGQGKKGTVKFCIIRDPWIDKVCILPDLVSELGLSSSQVTVTKDCADPKIPHYYLQNCYSAGIQQVYHQFNYTVKAMTELCKSGSKPSENKLASRFASIMEIFNSRMYGDGEEFGTIKMDKAETSIKTDFIMEFLDVFSQACPSSNPNYLSILGNVFLMHLRNVWNANPELIEQSNDYWWQSFDFLGHCGIDLHHMPMGPFLDVGCDVIPSDVAATNDVEFMAMEVMFQGDDFDVVIEQIWLILNFISPFCNHIDGYKGNLWADFPASFKKHYLIPLEKQWMSPGSWRQVYPIMFSGYDIPREHKQILSCVQTAIHMTPFLDPVGRTSGFDSIFWNGVNGTKPKDDGKKPSGGGGDDDEGKGDEGITPSGRSMGIKTPSQVKKLTRQRKGSRKMVPGGVRALKKAKKEKKEDSIPDIKEIKEIKEIADIGDINAI